MLKINDDMYGLMHQVTFVQLNKPGDLYGAWLPKYIPPDVVCAPIHMDIVEILNQRCGRVGSPYVLTSGYRTCGHNGFVGGAIQSGHLIGFAVDIGGKPAPLDDLYTDLYNGGVPGLIIHDTFLHIDFLPRVYRKDKRTKS